jgi:hypothetical protein
LGRDVVSATTNEMGIATTATRPSTRLHLVDRLEQLIEQQGQGHRQRRGKHVAHDSDAEAKVRFHQPVGDGVEVALD